MCSICSILFRALTLLVGHQEWHFTSKNTFQLFRLFTTALLFVSFKICCGLFQMMVSQYKGVGAPLFRSPVMNEETVRPGHWLGQGSVLRISFSALTLFCVLTFFSVGLLIFCLLVFLFNCIVGMGLVA